MGQKANYEPAAWLIQPQTAPQTVGPMQYDTNPKNARV